MSKKLLLLLLLAVIVPGCVKPPRQHTLTQAFSDLPRLGIYTGEPIDSKTEYREADFVLEDLQLGGKIRGRGNYTWDLYPKKPYRIKLDGEESLLGLAPSREWVLLADFRDPSLMRTAYLLGLANLAGLPFTSAYRHIDLYLNGEYQGVYILTEPVQSTVDTDPDGFIIEEDTYWADEPVWFRSGRGRYYTFKYPKKPDAADKRFISGLIDRVEGGENGLLDLPSFAKWFIVNELVGNYDPNMFYVLPSRSGKLMMCPAWDAESSLGTLLKPQTGKPELGSLNTGFSICTGLGYFRQLLADEAFISALRKEWAALKPLLPSFQEDMRNLAARLAEARAANSVRWPANPYLDLELPFVQGYFARRLNWFNYYIDFITTEPEPVPLADAGPDCPEPEAIDLGLSVLWASWNLGARNEYDSGSYFAWGETQQKVDYSWSSYAYGSESGFSKYCCDSRWWTGGGSPDNLITLEDADDPVRVHLGGGWRLPDRWELWELWNLVDSPEGRIAFETAENGTKGFRIYSSNGASIFFPFAGRASGSAIEDYGRYGYYWTSSLNRNAGDHSAGAYFLGVEATTEMVNQWTCGRYYGMPVRPVRDK